MATYKYQQNMFDGAAEGYVKYNVVPDFGTPMKLGDKFQISGQMYWRDSKVYGVQVETKVKTRSTAILGFVAKTASQRVATSFTVECTVTPQLLNQMGDVRAVNAPIKFLLFSDAEFTGGSSTFPVSGQELLVFKTILEPSITNIAISDETGAYEHFGGAVQNKSALVVDFDYEIDTLVPDNVVSSVSFDITSPASGDVSLKTTSVTLADGHGTAKFEAISELYYLAQIKVTIVDKMDKSCSALSGDASAFNVYAYASPVISTIGEKELIQRYDYEQDDYGNETTVFKPEGRYLSLDYEYAATSIAGKNVWKIEAYYGVDGEEEYVKVDGVEISGADGTTGQRENDTEIIPQDYMFDPGLKYNIRLVITDFFESVVLSGSADKATGYMHITKHGVSFGMRSNANVMTPMLESTYPIYAYQGIVGITNFNKGEFKGGLAPDGITQLYTQSLSAPVTAGSSVSIPVEDLDTVYRIEGVIIAGNNSVWPVNCYINSSTSCACYRSGSAKSLTLTSVGITGTAYVSVLYSKLVPTGGDDVVENYILYDDGYIDGIEWAVNTLPREGQTSMITAYLSGDNQFTMYKSGTNTTQHNAHFITTNPIAVPKAAVTMNIQAHILAGSCNVAFGLLPANASSSINTANGGQMTGNMSVSSTTSATYSLTLDDAVKGATDLHAVINGYVGGNRRLCITKVWFE